MVSKPQQAWISPFDVMRCNVTSMDITASKTVLRESFPTHVMSADSHVPLINPRGGSKLCLEQFDIAEGIIIPPDGTLTIITEEEISVPWDHAAVFQSVAYLNMSNIATVGGIWCRPGWSGKLNITLHNYNKMHGFMLTPGMVIGQLVFMKVEQNAS